VKLERLYIEIEGEKSGNSPQKKEFGVLKKYRGVTSGRGRNMKRELTAKHKTHRIWKNWEKKGMGRAGENC